MLSWSDPPLRAYLKVDRGMIIDIGKAYIASVQILSSMSASGAPRPLGFYDMYIIDAIR